MQMHRPSKSLLFNSLGRYMPHYQALNSEEQLAYRKRREICRKLATLEKELDSWLARSQAGQPFEKHHTQVRAIRAHLSEWHRTVRSLIREDLRSSAEEFLNSVFNAERLIQSEHRIWEYFRSKFIQRHEASFRQYLRVADEFAWSCYWPIQQTVYPDPRAASRKEPPLVFFNGGTSPFSLSRGKAFVPEVVIGESLDDSEIEAIRKLPISIVGIPWNQISHLPDAVVIGHEIGHVVEDDFGLTEAIERSLARALKDSGAIGTERETAWQSWIGETFADVYGCLATGPAFVGGLIDFLAREYSEISNERKSKEEWGDYPTTYLRGKLILETLKQIGFTKEAIPYEELWSKFKSKMDVQYEEDVKAIVTHLLNDEIVKTSGSVEPDNSITEIFKYTEVERAEEVGVAAALDQSMDPGVTDPRVLIASLRRAFEAAPREFFKKDFMGKMLNHFNTSVIKEGLVRNSEILLSEEDIQQLEQNAAEAAQLVIQSILKGTSSKTA